MLERTNLDFSDQELIAEIRSGSAVAFEGLMRRYEKLVYKVAYGYTGERESALDVVQNVFLRVHAKLSGFRDEGDLRNWILRITANESMNWKRSQRRHRAAELDEKTGGSSPPPQEDLFRRQERWSQLRESLLSLNPRHRLAVVLRYFEGMPVREIASVLDCSEGVAKNILFRSLRRMRVQVAASAEIST